MFVTRFAPSPTGYLHLGHAFSAVLAHRRARREEGRFLLRLEDIDGVRCRPAFAAAVLEDLAWLGLSWDGDVRVQSAHLAEYGGVLEGLAGRELLYPCFCSRAEIARAVGAPHGVEVVYPGVCRALPAAVRRARIDAGRAYALRLDVGRAAAGLGGLRFFEEGVGWVEVVPGRLGDVVLGRRDLMASYHLCSVHDDGVQGVTHVVRGEDLREAAPLHVLLQRLLGFETPVYVHHRLVVGDGGRRLAKRDFALTLRSVREAGQNPASVMESLGL